MSDYEEAPDDDVGYGKPPTSTRFRRGQDADRWEGERSARPLTMLGGSLSARISSFSTGSTLR